MPGLDTMGKCHGCTVHRRPVYHRIYLLHSVFGTGHSAWESHQKLLTQIRWYLPCVPVFWYESLLYMRDIVEFPRSRQFWEEPSSGISWAPGHLLSSHLGWYVELSYMQKGASANSQLVSLGCVWIVVGQRRPACPCCMLLCQYHDEAF